MEEGKEEEEGRENFEHLEHPEHPEHPLRVCESQLWTIDVQEERKYHLDRAASCQNQNSKAVNGGGNNGLGITSLPLESTLS